jgi:hypothetical protein
MAKATSCLHLPRGLFMQGFKQGSFHRRKELQNQVAFPFMYPNQGITNALALPIDKMLCIYLGVHTLNTKSICSNLNSRNTFTKEIGLPNMKLVLIR